MKARVLYTRYSDGSGFSIHRVYLEPDFEQAEKDFALISEAISSDKTAGLTPVELFTSKNQNENE